MKNVLIADDSMFMRGWIKELLHSRRYRVIAEAKDGQTAINQFKDVKPDIVLLDITMPKVNGLTALKEILELDSNANVVMCSSISTQSNVIEAMKTGAKDFIVKPNFDSINEVLDEISS